ncbi:MAG: D-2-hydroxyacid dehydrogenase [Phycisphaeraceae bacterium]
MHVLMTFRLPDDALARLRERVGESQVHIVARETPDYERWLGEAEVAMGAIPAADLPRAAKLRWMQLPSAGVGRFADIMPNGAILTNASGVFGVPIAEHVLAMMLGFAHQLPRAVRAAVRARWDTTGLRFELAGQTVCIVGLGDIGRELARRCKALDMRILAVRRAPQGTKPDFVDELGDITSLERLLGPADHVVNALPDTKATHELFDAGRFAQMHRGAYFYNVGRGGTVVEPALIQALNQGHLAGAGLDVFAAEPLPGDSPLWKMENVIITPHRAGDTPHNARRLAEIFLANLDRFLRGHPLQNVVEADKGY